MDDTAMMREALRLAQEAADDGEVPVGCVVAMEDGRVVGRGRNRREKGKSALAHAELEAIGEACRTLGGWQASPMASSSAACARGPLPARRFRAWSMARQTLKWVRAARS